MNDVSADEADREDMARLVAGSDSALNSLMERHGAALFRYLLRLLQDETRANDAAQETFVKVYLNRARFKTDSKFSTWLYAIATNLARDHFRWKQRHPEVSIEAETEDGPNLAEILRDGIASPREAMVEHERSEAVRRAVQALPEELRTALVLSEYEDLSQEEIAQVLGCTRKAVEMRLYRARAILRKSLSGLVETTD